MGMINFGNELRSADDVVYSPLTPSSEFFAEGD
jgi:hypothetical protein